MRGERYIDQRRRPGTKAERDRAIKSLAARALEVAAKAPLRQNAASAQIPWRLIIEIREELEAIGIDWRQFKADDEARRRNPN